MDVIPKGEVSFVVEAPKLSGDACYSSILEPVPINGAYPTQHLVSSNSDTVL